MSLSVAPKDQIVAPGYDVYLYCIASPPPEEITWLKDSTPLRQEVGGVNISGFKVGEVLSIWGFSADMEGSYTCVCASPSGKTVNATAQLALLSECSYGNRVRTSIFATLTMYTVINIDPTKQSRNE